MQGKYSMNTLEFFHASSSLLYVHTICTWQVKELIARKWLSDPEVHAWEYLHILETYYPLQSYEEAHALYSKHHARSGEEEEVEVIHSKELLPTIFCSSQ